MTFTEQQYKIIENFLANFVPRRQFPERSVSLGTMKHVMEKLLRMHDMPEYISEVDCRLIIEKNGFKAHPKTRALNLSANTFWRNRSDEIMNG